MNLFHNDGRSGPSQHTAYFAFDFSLVSLLLLRLQNKRDHLYIFNSYLYITKWRDHGEMIIKACRIPVPAWVLTCRHELLELAGHGERHRDLETVAGRRGIKSIFCRVFLRFPQVASFVKKSQFSQPEPGNLGQISEGKSTPIKAVSGGEHAKAVERFA